MTIGFSNPLLRELSARGFFYQFTDLVGIDDLFNSKNPVTFYIGFDPTAKNLHVGHLFWIRLVGIMKKYGHNPIVLCGGATAQIGDPTWKDKERAQLEIKTIEGNIQSILGSLTKLIGDVQIKNNIDWLSKLNYLEFLRDYGSLFSVNRMLSMDSVNERLKRQQHLSFLEFNYALLQAYDFLHLFEEEGCRLEIGGADQWSNIISGVDIIKRRLNEEVYGLTMPLLTTANGVKMGKTVGGAVWLSPEMTSPFDFWQFWRNVDDKDVCKLLKIFTDLPLAEIESYESQIGTSNINDAKIKLADFVTAFVHSAETVESVKHTVGSLFKGEASSLEDLLEVRIEAGTSLDKVLFASGVVSSMTIARKLIESKAVKVENEVIVSIKHKIEKNCIIKAGKKNFFKVIII